MLIALCAVILAHSEQSRHHKTASDHAEQYRRDVPHTHVHTDELHGYREVAMWNNYRRHHPATMLTELLVSFPH